MSASFPRGWAKRTAERKGAGQCEEQRLAMYVSLHSPRALFAQRSAAPDPPLGKICATLDGVRRPQRLGYREGLLLTARMRGIPYSVGGRDFQYRAAGAPYSPSRNEGRQRMPLRRATGEEQTIMRGGVNDRLPRARIVLLRRAAAGVGAYLGRRSPVGQGGVRDHPRMRVSAALCTLAEHVARISGIICRPRTARDRARPRKRHKAVPTL